MTKDQHQRSVSQYRTDTLLAIQRDLLKKSKKDTWDRDRIATINSELKRRANIK